ncbi:MAG: hypothetical protein K6T78_02625 [Alicyclobacillus sp.]|nr:hypothetical protein [Alicyclobacillus sp.]
MRMSEADLQRRNLTWDVLDTRWNPLACLLRDPDLALVFGVDRSSWATQRKQARRFA